MDVGPAGSVAEKSLSIRQHFRDLIRLVQEFPGGLRVAVAASKAVIADALERFSLWAGNLGAMRQPLSKLSLDYRLRGAPEVREQISLQLEELDEALSDLEMLVSERYVKRSPTARDSSFNDEGKDADAMDIDVQADDDAADEVHVNLEVVSECIKSLFRIAILVRKTGAGDRFKRSLRMSDSAFPASFDIDYVAQKYPKAQQGVPKKLADRLGIAIAKRRQFIKYCRDHRARLGSEEPGVVAEDGRTLTEARSSKATSLRASELLPSSGVADEDDGDDNISLMSASTMADSLSSLRLPPLSDLSPEHEPFECPICFTMQSFKSEKSWIIHAFQDLKAYICTVGDSSTCDAEYFGDRNSWFEHELKHHRSQYSCTLCNVGQPMSRTGIRSHIVTAHGNFAEDQLRSLEDAGRQTPQAVSPDECPFCDEWAAHLREKADLKGKQAQGSNKSIRVATSRFKRHVASHQEQLAIFAVPRASHQDGTPGSGSVCVAGSLSSRGGSPMPSKADPPSPSPAALNQDETPTTFDYSVDSESGSEQTRSSQVSLDEYQAYRYHIDNILASSDPSTVSRKLVRNRLETLLGGKNRSHHQSIIDKLTEECFNATYGHLSPRLPGSPEAVNEHETPSDGRTDNHFDQGGSQHNRYIVEGNGQTTRLGMTCEICGHQPKGNPKRFAVDMAMHKSLHHPSGFLYECAYPACKKLFANQDGLQQHQRNEGHSLVSERQNSQKPAASDEEPMPGTTDGSNDSLLDTTSKFDLDRRHWSQRKTGSGPIEELEALADMFTSNWLPLCEQFIASPPSDIGKLEQEHRRLSESILQQVLLKLDEVGTLGLSEAREKRRELVKQVQETMKDLDRALPDANRPSTSTAD